MRAKTKFRTSSLVIMFFLFLLNTGCKKNDSVNIVTGKNVYTIAVISDIHYMDPALYSDTSHSLQGFIPYDQRLIVQSDAIMREVVEELINAKPKPDLVLIPGDLSFDGEQASHDKVALFLLELTSAGIKVRVIDGNHDINFRMAVSFLGHDTMPVANITPAYFRNLYSNYGYSDAISIDPTSLSYVSEPLPGLWLLSIDDCKYDIGISYNTSVSGAIKQSTMTWALARLAEAGAKGKMVFGMMHHALINHYTDQNVWAPGFVVDRSSTVSDSLMNGGLKVMFTGHGHSTDIAKKTSGNNFLYDIETSSTVVYPCTYRMITYIKDSALIISTIPITNINHQIPGGQTFQAYAKQRLCSTMDTDFAASYLSSYHMDTAVRLARRMRTANMAQMAGDEQIFSTSENDSIETTINWLGGGVTAENLKTNWLNLWYDLTPADNFLMICLKSGACYKK